MAKKYSTREVVHGISYGAFAKIVNNGGAIDTAQVPEVFTGVRGSGFEETRDKSTYYADNVPQISISGAPSVEGDITCYQIPVNFMVNHLGKKLVAATGALLDTGIAQNFIWQFIETVNDEFGAEFDQLHVYYNVSAGAATGDAATDEDTVEPREITIPCTATPNPLVLDADGKAVTEMIMRKTDQNKALFDLAYDQIILPITPIP